MKAFSGGEALQAKLKELATKVSAPGTLEVGFLEGSTTEDGESMPQLAFWNEFGTTRDIEEHETTIYRQVNKAQTEFTKKGRFVKRAQSNFESTHTVPAHTVTVPPRPFFRTMIAEKSSGWGDSIAIALKDTEYDTKKTLDKVGEGIEGQLKQSIANFTSPANAPSTIREKGFNDPLVDKGDMLNATGHRVVTSDTTS